MRRILCFITAVALLCAAVPVGFAEDAMVSLYIRNHSFEEGGYVFVESGDEIPGWSLFGDIPATSMSGADFMFIEIAEKSRKGLDLSYAQCKTPSDGEKCLALIDGLLNSALYMKSDEVSVNEGFEYTLSYDIWTDWRGAHGMAFYNREGKLYKNGSWIDATDANLRSICGNGYTTATPPPGITTYKGNVWNKVTDKFTAPAGAVKARILLFSAVAANANSNFDNVRLEFPRSLLKVDAGLENGSFEKGLEGWEGLFGADINEFVSVSNSAGCIEILCRDEVFIASKPVNVFKNVKYSIWYSSDMPLGCSGVFFNAKGEIYSASSESFIPCNEENLTSVVLGSTVSEAPEGAVYMRIILMPLTEKTVCGMFELSFIPPSDFAVSSPVLEKNGKIFTEGEKYSAGDGIRLKMSLYNGGTVSENLKLIICRYSADGSLSGITAKNISAAGVANGDVNECIYIDEAVNVGLTDGYIRAFAVNSFVTMNDFVSPLEHKLNIEKGE